MSSPYPFQPPTRAELAGEVVSVVVAVAIPLLEAALALRAVHYHRAGWAAVTGAMFGATLLTGASTVARAVLRRRRRRAVADMWAQLFARDADQEAGEELDGPGLPLLRGVVDLERHQW